MTSFMQYGSLSCISLDEGDGDGDGDDDDDDDESVVVEGVLERRC